MGSPDSESGLISFCLFLDENHCRNPHILAVLQELGIRYESHLDHFAPGTEDVVWLPEVGKRGWSLLTTDKRIRKRPLEREAVRSNAVRMFYFSSNTLAGSEMGNAIRHAAPKMVALVKTQTPPFAASISRLGDVELKDLF